MKENVLPSTWKNSKNFSSNTIINDSKIVTFIMGNLKIYIRPPQYCDINQRWTLVIGKTHNGGERSAMAQSFSKRRIRVGKSVNIILYWIYWMHRRKFGRRVCESLSDASRFYCGNFQNALSFRRSRTRSKVFQFRPTFELKIWQKKMTEALFIFIIKMTIINIKYRIQFPYIRCKQ